MQSYRKLLLLFVILVSAAISCGTPFDNLVTPTIMGENTTQPTASNTQPANNATQTLSAVTQLPIITSTPVQTVENAPTIFLTPTIITTLSGTYITPLPPQPDCGTDVSCYFNANLWYVAKQTVEARTQPVADDNLYIIANAELVAGQHIRIRCQLFKPYLEIWVSPMQCSESPKIWYLDYKNNVFYMEITPDYSPEIN